MTSDATRIEYLEAALLDLLERIAVLERSLRFEIAQREAMEQTILVLTGLPCRIDRLERESSARRRGHAA